MSEFNVINSKVKLRNIKSSFIIKRIFSFLYKRIKLNMIIYNKELQKICLIDIENYKQASGKYKIGGKNGKGKEYIINTDILIFEGEYLNGERNGKGKEYYKNGKLLIKYITNQKYERVSYNQTSKYKIISKILI